MEAKLPIVQFAMKETFILMEVAVKVVRVDILDIQELLLARVNNLEMYEPQFNQMTLLGCGTPQDIPKITNYADELPWPVLGIELLRKLTKIFLIITNKLIQL